MEVKKGYKQTEVGVIPEDWEVRKLGEIAEVTKLAGYEYSKYFNSYKDGGEVIVIRGTNITHNNLDLSDIKTIPRETSNCLQRSKLNKNDIVFAYVGTIGPVYLIEEDDKYHLGPNTSKITINKYNNPKFLYIYFISSLIKGEIAEQISVSAQPSLSMSKIRNFKIIIPPTISEQTAIAYTISDVDVLIQSLEKLIAKKRAIKQGAMEELLTGKRRLSGYGKSEQKYKQTELAVIPEDWRACRFGDVLTGFSSGMTPYRGRPEYYKGDIPWITSGELNYNVITNTKEKITKEAVVKTNLKVLPKGTFLMAITGLEAEGTRGSCGITGINATTNQSCMALFPIKGEITVEYLYNFYVLYGDELALKYCQGTKQQSYTGKIAKILPINLPPTIEEQTAIVNILSDMDDEISDLESKLAKYKQIKQGMMQNLLTGRIRLV